jgi:hypothetical protein
MHVECGNGGGDASALPEWVRNFAVFEKEIGYFRRYAAAEIRDRRTQPLPICDAVPELPELDPVERGCRMFLRVCEEGTVVAERFGSCEQIAAYVEMLQRQRKMFYRALSDLEAAPALDSSSDEAWGLLPAFNDPEFAADPEAAVMAMPTHQLIVHYFVACAAEGMAFYAALADWDRRHAEARRKQEMPDRAVTRLQ